MPAPRQSAPAFDGFYSAMRLNLIFSISDSAEPDRVEGSISAPSVTLTRLIGDRSVRRMMAAPSEAERDWDPIAQGGRDSGQPWMRRTEYERCHTARRRVLASSDLSCFSTRGVEDLLGQGKVQSRTTNRYHIDAIGLMPIYSMPGVSDFTPFSFDEARARLASSTRE